MMLFAFLSITWRQTYSWRQTFRLASPPESRVRLRVDSPHLAHWRSAARVLAHSHPRPSTFALPSHGRLAWMLAHCSVRLARDPVRTWVTLRLCEHRPERALLPCVLIATAPILLLHQSAVVVLDRRALSLRHFLRRLRGVSLYPSRNCRPCAPAARARHRSIFVGPPRAMSPACRICSRARHIRGALAIAAWGSPRRV